jgi:hypothetical protein
MRVICRSRIGRERSAAERNTNDLTTEATEFTEKSDVLPSVISGHSVANLFV